MSNESERTAPIPSAKQVSRAGRSISGEISSSEVGDAGYSQRMAVTAQPAIAALANTTKSAATAQAQLSMDYETSAACAAASLAIGTRYGEQLT